MYEYTLAGIIFFGVDYENARRTFYRTDRVLLSQRGME